jgi:CheY-like chemotaxis protein
VRLASDGQKAFELMRREKSQLVVMDIRMPNVDGGETLVAVLGGNRTLPVILSSAYLEYRDNFLTWGAEAFVTKSSDLTALKQKIHEILDRRKRLTPEADQPKRRVRKTR